MKTTTEERLDAVLMLIKAAFLFGWEIVIRPPQRDSDEEPSDDDTERSD